MNQQQVNQEPEKVILIDINLTRGLMSILAVISVIVIMIGALTWKQRRAYAANLPAPIIEQDGVQQ